MSCSEKICTSLFLQNVFGCFEEGTLNAKLKYLERSMKLDNWNFKKGDGGVSK